MPTANEAYNSNTIPFGGITVKMYRGQTTPTLLGTYIIESISPTPGAVANNRPAVDGGDGGWWAVNGITEGPCVVQLATDESPTLENGDWFKTDAIRRDANGDGIMDYFAILNPAPEVSTTGYRKQNATARRDKTPTAAQEGMSA